MAQRPSVAVVVGMNVRGSCVSLWSGAGNACKFGRGCRCSLRTCVKCACAAPSVPVSPSAALVVSLCARVRRGVR